MWWVSLIGAKVLVLGNADLAIRNQANIDFGSKVHLLFLAKGLHWWDILVQVDLAHISGWIPLFVL